MRVFVTGATGFIGSRVVRELIENGYEVLGMARSAEGEKKLGAMGARAHRADLADLDALRGGAEGADAVIHLAFSHDFSKFLETCAIDRRAIEALGSVLAGSARPFLVTSALGALVGPGQIATEDIVPAADSPFPRVSEQTARSLEGVDVRVIRLSQTHDAFKQGLVTNAIEIARRTGVSAYAQEGANRWAAVHVDDVARLYRLALEKGESGAVCHGVAEEGVPMRDIAEAIGKRLGAPVRSLTREKAREHFGWFDMFAGQDLIASSAVTKHKLGWIPTGPGLIEDIEGPSD